jgi:exonuclease V gamma subunit
MFCIIISVAYLGHSLISFLLLESTKKSFGQRVSNVIVDVYNLLTHGCEAVWYEVESRRNFFEKYARDNKFDPLKAENWYKQPRDRILATKGTRSVIYYHNNSVSKALIDLFPDIGLEMSKFQRCMF